MVMMVTVLSLPYGQEPADSSSVNVRKKTFDLDFRNKLS